MRNRFSSRILMALILIIFVGMIFSGCGSVAPTPTPTPTPMPCTITVYSQDFWCYGYVWVNGMSTGQWIDFNGSVTVTGLVAGTTATVQLVDNSGFYSHQEILILNPGNNIVQFQYW